MHAEGHARLMNLFTWVTLVAALPVTFVFGCSWLYGEANLLLPVAFGLAWFVLYTVLWRVIPVRCKAPGCGGRMEKTRTPISDWKCELEYRCKVCGEVSVAVNLDLPKGDFFLP